MEQSGQLSYFFIYVSAVGRSAGQKASEGMFSSGTDAFSDFAPAPIWKALTKSGSKAGRNPLRHGFAVPPLPKGRGFGKGEKFSGYRLISSPVDG